MYVEYVFMIEVIIVLILYIIKRKLKPWWSTIPQQELTTSHLKSLNTEKMTFADGNPGLGFRDRHKTLVDKTGKNTCILISILKNGLNFYLFFSIANLIRPVIFLFFTAYTINSGRKRVSAIIENSSLLIT